jgi:hypothetical protein
VSCPLGVNRELAPEATSQQPGYTRRTRMSSIGITANVELADLVDMIIDDVSDHETIRNFILALDRAVADYNFTVDLRNRLNEAIYETW